MSYLTRSIYGLAVLLSLGLQQMVMAKPWFQQPEAMLLEQSVAEGNVRVILGDVKKIRSKWVSEIDWHLFSQHQDWLYEFPRGTEWEEVYLAGLKHNSLSGLNALRQCKGRLCGSSSFYANQVFGVRTLYGRDDNQAYAIWLDKKRSRLTIMYVVERGNRKVQSLVRQLTVSEQQAKELLSKVEGGSAAKTTDNANTALASSSWTFFVNDANKIDWQQSAAAISSLITALNQNAQRQAYLVVYVYSPGPLMTTQKSSLRFAESIIDHLKAKQVSTEQLELVGAGAIKVIPSMQLQVEWIPKPL